jgi:2-C-methyl-D-erythritol 4-phosphate cytidylyltransferase
MSVAALIVGAGRGHRMAGAIPKQYRQLGDAPVLRHTLLAFTRHPGISCVQLVIHVDDLALCEAAMAGLGLAPPVPGGRTRQASVLRGLEALGRAAPEKVLIHDAVRPFVAPAIITAVIAALDTVPGAIVALPVVDSLKRCEAGQVRESVPREGLWRAQTPQGFRFPAILAAHRALALRPDLPEQTDDAAVAAFAGLAIAVVSGSEVNFKITTEPDLTRAEQLLRAGVEELT